jgi:beta-mannosidase
MMETIALSGKWELRQDKVPQPIPATVPGCVHTDLLAAGRIPDPFYREQENDVQWIGETGWTYSRRFDVASDVLRCDRVLLHCDGLDTFATVTVNGRRVGKSDNMFRTWEFDVKDALRAGANEIVVHFDSTFPHIAKQQKAHPIPLHNPTYRTGGDNWVRKQPCHYGWDWGPTLVTAGIWRDIRLVAYTVARIGDVHVRQDHSVKGRVGLSVAVTTESARPAGKSSAAAKLVADVVVTFEGRKVAAASAPVHAGKSASVDLAIARPKLWWPRGMGEQPLYDVSVTLRGADGETLDTASQRIGLRTLGLRRQKDQWGESFEFLANGVAFFAKGANWIPADIFVSRLTRADYARLLGDAAAANMNMIRAWGGGIYEEDCFYDICDELGLCVWQDFIFACAAYPTFDKDFMASVEAEARDNVRRLRHHPSIALWCGNNEIEQARLGKEWTDHAMSWGDYSKLFDKLIPGVTRELDPDRDYWPSSPHTPYGDRNDHSNPDCGDAHLWAVWHGRQPFEWYRTSTHRFCSEFGFQSFPEPKTVRTYTALADRNITHPVMEHHQRSHIGNTAIMTYMLDWFRLPSRFDDVLWLSQILQGMSMKYAVEHWRRQMPRTMGALYWQLNDCWPVASWASIDSLGRWKALQYMARHFFAPLLVSGLEDAKKGTVEIHVTSDLMKATTGEVDWTLTDTDGAKIAGGKHSVRIAARKSARVETLNLAPYVKKHGARRLLLWLELRSGREVVSTNLVTFARPKQLELADPEIAVTLQPVAEGEWRARLTVKRPALWAWVDLSRVNARLSDSFVHLAPGKPVEITIRPDRSLTREALEQQLVVRSLIDTF